MNEKIKSLENEIMVLKQQTAEKSSVNLQKRFLLPNSSTVTPPKIPLNKDGIEENSKILKNASVSIRGEDNLQINQILSFIRQTMVTLSDYKKRLKGHLNTEMTQMET